jgi:formamidopyrimidine-DNA glycosylase
VPELPEVETVRRGLEPLVVGLRVVAAGSHPTARFTAATDAVDQRIEAVGRRGKYLVLALSDDRRMVVHLGMTGQLRVDPRPGDGTAGTTDDLRADPYDRAWWTLDDGGRLALRDVRRFGRVAVVGDDLSSLPTFAALGPEPFDPAFTPGTLHAALRRSRARVKTQLLGQRAVAGVGNIYADEALHRARIHPLRAANSLRPEEIAALHEAVRHVLAAGILAEGSSINWYRKPDGTQGDMQNRFLVYGREGQPCPACGAPIHKIRVAQRGTHYCPVCQPAPARP